MYHNVHFQQQKKVPPDNRVAGGTLIVPHQPFQNAR